MKTIEVEITFTDSQLLKPHQGAKHKADVKGFKFELTDWHPQAVKEQVEEYEKELKQFWADIRIALKEFEEKVSKKIIPAPSQIKAVGQTREK